MTRPGHRGPIGDELPVECWCRAHIVHQPAQAIRDGITGTCGAPTCHPPEEAPRP